MTLTNEDLAVLGTAIKEEVRDVLEEHVRPMIKEEVGSIIDEKLEKFEEKFEKKLDVKLEEKLSPICEAVKKLVQTQILVVEDIADMKSKLNILVYNAALPSASHELRNTLKTLH